MSSVLVAPECCGEPCLDVSTDLDRGLCQWRWRCVECERECLYVRAPSGPGGAGGGPPPGAGPTAHPAGSEGKIEVLALRALSGLPLFHPGDSPEREAQRSPAAEPGGSRGGGLPRGVSWDQKKGKYRARLKVGPGRRVYCGLHDTVEEAVAAIEAARRGRR